MKIKSYVSIDLLKVIVIPPFITEVKSRGLSHYMLFVANVRESIQCEINKNDELLFGINRLNIKRSTIPAVTHVDY